MWRGWGTGVKNRQRDVSVYFFGGAHDHHHHDEGDVNRSGYTSLICGTSDGVDLRRGKHGPLVTLRLNSASK